MKLFFILLLCLVGCKSKTVTEPSYLYDGSVFAALPLSTPNTVRSASGVPGKDYWQQVADHNIEVRLDIEQNSIIGSESITYHNNSPDTLTYIWLHLEQNVHRDDSVRSREGRATGEEEYGGIIITQLDVDEIPATWHD